MEKIWNDDRVSFLIENYSDNGAKFISEKIGLEISQIRNKVRKLGLKVSKDRICSKRGNYKKQYNVEDITKNINNYNSYILGYLWSDGTILYSKKVINLTIMKSDMDEIKWIFNLAGKWHSYNRIREGRKEQVSISTYNPILIDNLLELDFDKKSIISPTKIWDILNNEQRKYFFRGIIDRDGCFYIKKGTYQFCISSTYDYDWSLYECIFTDFGLKYSISRRLHKGSKSSTIRISNKKDIISLVKWLYDGYEKDNIGLSRKYKKCIIDV